MEIVRIFHSGCLLAEVLFEWFLIHTTVQRVEQG